MVKRWTDPVTRFDIGAAFDSADPWVTHTDLQNLQTTGANLSYGIALADLRLKPSGQTRYVIHYSASGSRTSGVNAPNPLATWDPGTDNSSYELFTEGYLIPALAALPKPIELGGIYITLGGNDAQDEGASADYTNALTAVLDGIKTILDVDKLPVIGDYAPLNADPAVFVYRNTVRNQQTTIATTAQTGSLEHVKFLDSDLIPTHDGVHWTHDGVVTTGIRMAKAMLTDLNPPGTEPLITE